jgi:hypothetical protein
MRQEVSALSEVACLLRSLPPCGGGLGRGVPHTQLYPLKTPLPPMLRIVDLPHKGAGNKRGFS